MHKHTYKIRKYDRSLRLTIATAITAISIFSFEIIPMATIPAMNAVIQQQQQQGYIIRPIIIIKKLENEHVIAFSPFIFLYSVSDRKSTKYDEGQYHSVSIKDERRLLKRILIVDDNEDITLAFKVGIEDNNTHTDRRIEVHTSNNPVIALSEFKSNFYDLLLVDIKMPQMNGNRKALREKYPSLSVGCFIRKPVAIDYLIKRIISELE